MQYSANSESVIPSFVSKFLSTSNSESGKKTLVCGKLADLVLERNLDESNESGGNLVMNQKSSNGLKQSVSNQPEQIANQNSRNGFEKIASKKSKLTRLPSNRDARFERFQEVEKLFNSKTHHQKGTIDFEQLRKDSWLGIPSKMRPLIWRLLSGYIPTDLDRKRNEYWQFTEQFFHVNCYEKHQDTFRQIQVDIPRMRSLTPLFEQKIVQRIFERVLYIWAVLHPDSGYVQGMNDLLTPFFVVFLSEFVPEFAEIEKFDVSQLTKEQIEIIEADNFWCFTSLLDTLQDNYTFKQPGIQRKMSELQYLMTRIDADLTRHLRVNQVGSFLFSFRWMNNILMREIPLSATIRLWDTYLSEPNGFSELHVYVCAAFLRVWSKQLLEEKDLQGIMILIQDLPTQDWNDKQISELTADAYRLMKVFQGAKRVM